MTVACLYGQSLGFGYVWDDNVLFLDNTLLRQGDWSWATVARPILPGTSYFRPLVLASWMAEMQFFQLTPAYSHAINLVLHAINTCLLYVIACRVFDRYEKAHIAALWTALIYTVHPCLVEGVAWISGRFDLLATTLLMAGCAVALNRVTMLRWLLAALYAIGAMLSKETGVLLAPILILLACARHPEQSIRETLSDIWPYLGAYVVAFIGYFWLRRLGLGFASYSGFGLSQIIDAGLHYEGWMRKLSFYTFMSFAPFSSLTPRHDWAIEMLSYRQHMAALVAALLLAVFIVVNALRRKTWAILWIAFYVSIFPVLGIVSIAVGETIGAERFLYLPLAMMTLAIVALFLYFRERYNTQRLVPVIGLILAIGWLLLSLLVTYTVTSMWESGVRLWSWQYHVNPNNTLVRSSYLLELSKNKNSEARERFEQEINNIRNKNDGRLPMEVQVLYAGYLLEKGDKESFYYLKGLVENMPDFSEKSQMNGRWDESFYSGIFSNYAQALVMFDGDLREARKYLEKAELLGSRGSEFRILHQKIAIEYLDGNKISARKIYVENFNLLQSYNINKMKRSMGALVKGYCLREREQDYCDIFTQDFLNYIEMGLKK